MAPGVISLTIGGIIGGIVISRDGLGKWMLPMILAMHLPIIGFILSHFHLNQSITYMRRLCGTIWLWVRFCCFLMYLIYVADGESKTSHYSIATGFMALGMMLPGMLSGFIKNTWAMETSLFGCLLPPLILSRYLIFPKEFGKKSEQK
jgi:PAT family beta-lactamase induction signal transducer AmpG